MQMEGLLESLNEGVIISDDCHRIVFANSNFEEMIGAPSEELIGRESSHFYTPVESEFISRQIERSAQRKRNRFEFVLPLKDGSRLPVIISSRTIEDPDGREFAIVTFTDISEQKSAEAQLRDSKREGSPTARRKSRRTWRWRPACSKVSRPNRLSGAGCASKPTFIPCARSAAISAW